MFNELIGRRQFDATQWTREVLSRFSHIRPLQTSGSLLFADWLRLDATYNGGGALISSSGGGRGSFIGSGVRVAASYMTLESSHGIKDRCAYTASEDRPVTFACVSTSVSAGVSVMF